MASAHPPLTRAEEIKIFAIVSIVAVAGACLVFGVLALIFGMI